MNKSQFLITMLLSVSSLSFAQKNIRKAHPINKDTRLKSEALLTEGMKFYVLDNYSSSLSKFKKAHALNPKSDGINFMIAKAYQKLHNPKLSEEYIDKAIALSPDNKHYYFFAAQLSDYQENPKKAIKYLTTYIDRSPKAILSTYLQVVHLYEHKLRDYAAALNFIRRTEEKFGQNRETFIMKRSLYNELGMSKEETEMAKKLYKIDNNALNSVYYANLLSKQGDKEAAAIILKKVITSTATGNFAYSRAQFLLSEIYGDATSDQSQLDAFLSDPSLNTDTKLNLILKGVQDGQNIQKPIQQLQNLLKKDPTHAKANIIIGRFYLQKNNYSEAQKHLIIGLDNGEQTIEEWKDLLIVDYRLDDAKKLLEHSDEALELYPNYALFWLYQGKGYFLQKDYNNANQAYDMGISLSKTSPKLYYAFHIRKADCFNMQKKYKQADALYDQVLARDPNNLDALNSYAYYLAKRNQKLKFALQKSKKLVSISQDPVYIHTHGWVLFKMKNYTESEKYLEKAARLTKKSYIIEHYGDLLHSIGKKEKAIKEWQRAKKLGSTTINKKLKDYKQ